MGTSLAVLTTLQQCNTARKLPHDLGILWCHRQWLKPSCLAAHFLQICAALAATVSCSTPEPLSPEAAAVPPSDFLCPISQQIMVQPVLLVETGHSFEAAHIARWLDTHDTCPISRTPLHSKQVVTNFNLKKAIADWAATHGINLPAAPAYTSLHAGVPPHSNAQAAASPAAPAGFTAASASQQQQQQQQNGENKDVVVEMTPMTAGLLSSSKGDRSSQQGSSRCQCSRTKWAAGIIALLLVVGGVAAGVGVYMAVRRNKGEGRR